MYFLRDYLNEFWLKNYISFDEKLKRMLVSCYFNGEAYLLKINKYEAMLNNYKTIQIQCAVFNFAITFKQ